MFRLLKLAILWGTFVAAEVLAHDDASRFPPLTGPYQVGVAELFWVDSDRDEPATIDPDDNRHLLVRAYYPANPTPTSELAPYVPNFEEFTPEVKAIFDASKGVVSRSYLNAPIIDGREKLPVLLYSHGGSWSRFTSNFVNEVLASHGYVVFSIDHTGFNKSTVFPDGYVYENELLPQPEQDPAKTIAENGISFFDYLDNSVFGLWVDDASFTLDKIEELNSTDQGRFEGKLNLEQVGAFGWSFGGATAIQLTHSDPRIRAAVDHDGQLFGSVRAMGTDRPIMLIHAGGNPNPNGDESLAELIDLVNSEYSELIKIATNDWYRIKIKGSKHVSFSDLTLFPSADGVVENQHQTLRLHRVIIDLTRDFFDVYLRGWPKTPLLQGHLESYPEIVYQSNAKRTNLFDQRVKMRDGVELSTNIFLPDAEGAFPSVLFRTPYHNIKATFDRYNLATYVKRGYAVVMQDTRGQGLSDGQFNFFFPEGHDGYDTIEWIADQPWSNAKVAMDGGSYLATVQWLAALEQPPHLKCIMPHAPAGRPFDEIPYIGGAFAMEWALPWIAPRYAGTSKPATDGELAEVAEHRPLLTMDEEYSGKELLLYREFLSHPTLDSYWAKYEVSGKEFEQIKIPALTVTGWFDGDQSGALHYWHGARKHADSAENQHLIIGPWLHAQTYLNGDVKLGEMRFSHLSAIDMQVVRLAFLDWCLKGDVEQVNLPRALVYLTGTNKWLELDDYPAPDSQTIDLFLSSGGHANTLAGDGELVLTVPAADQPDQFTFDPKKPVPSRPATYDHSEIEQRQDVLVYTGSVLEAPLTVLGSPVVELYVSSDALDTDFTAKLLDVQPDGRAIALNYSLGVARARYRHGYDKEVMLTPGEPALIRIELSAVGHVFQSGHRVRVEVSSSNYPYVNPNQNTGNPVATDTDWREAKQTIYHSVEYPSRIQLTVIPAESSIN